jgi:hypothetical protein
MGVITTQATLAIAPMCAEVSDSAALLVKVRPAKFGKQLCCQ